jgi:hypothetical protein
MDYRETLKNLKVKAQPLIVKGKALIEEIKDTDFDWDIPKHRWIGRGVIVSIILVLYLIGGGTAIAIAALYLVLLIIFQNTRSFG